MLQIQRKPETLIKKKKEGKKRGISVTFDEATLKKEGVGGEEKKAFFFQ